MKADNTRLACVGRPTSFLLKELEAIRKKRNEVAEKMKSASAEERPSLIEEGKELKVTLATKEAGMRPSSRVETALLAVPNMTHPDSPIGASDRTTSRRRYSAIPSPSFTPKSHVELANARFDRLNAEQSRRREVLFLKGSLRC